MRIFAHGLRRSLLDVMWQYAAAEYAMVPEFASEGVEILRVPSPRLSRVQVSALVAESARIDGYSAPGRQEQPVNSDHADRFRAGIRECEFESDDL